MLYAHARSGDRSPPSHSALESDRPSLPAMRRRSRSPLVWLLHRQPEPAPNALLPAPRGAGLRRIRTEFQGALVPSRRQQFRALVPRWALGVAPRPTARRSWSSAPQAMGAILATFLFCRVSGLVRAVPLRVANAAAQSRPGLLAGASMKAAARGHVPRVRETASIRERTTASVERPNSANLRPAAQAFSSVAAAALGKPGSVLISLNSPRSMTIASAMASLSESESIAWRNPPASRAASCSMASACSPCRRLIAASPRSLRHDRRECMTSVSRTSIALFSSGQSI